MIVGWLLEILRLGLGIPSVPCLELFMRRICARWIPHMIDEKRPGMLQTAIIHHGNAPSHRAAQTMETIKRFGFELLDHPLLIRLGPLWFFLFPLIKSVLRGTWFRDVAALPVAVQQAIAEIPVYSYWECFPSYVNAAESVWIARNTILREIGIVLCANVLANNDGTDFSYWCAGSRDLTLPWRRLKGRH